MYPYEQVLENRFFERGSPLIDELLSLVYIEPINEAEKLWRRPVIQDWSAWRQVPITSIGTADLLVYEHDPGRITIIELKRLADESAVAQALRYEGSLALAFGSRLVIHSAVAAFDFTDRCVSASIASTQFGPRRSVSLIKVSRDMSDLALVEAPLALPDRSLPRCLNFLKAGRRG
ncbi:MAG: hypothetical protein KGL39_31125 [Patescibacteria group bacterium]|nr:hypothetical protein [Patescibacteria group bacterium]